MWGNNIPINPWYGSTFTVNVPESKTYYVMLVADNSSRSSFDGVVELTSNVNQIVIGEGHGTSGPSSVTFSWLHIYPFYLTEGCHTITVEGNNDGGARMFGGAILNNTD